jgi:hypothetical protein
VGGAAPRRSRGKLVGLIIAALVVAVLLALLLSRCGGDQNSSSGATQGTSSAAGTSSQNTPSAASSAGNGGGATSAVTPGPAAGTPGTVTAGTQSLLDAAGTADPAAALAGLSGQPVTGSAVQVLSVPADEGFWAGTSDTARVWVQLTGDSESTYQVAQGDTVDFAGTLVGHDSTFASTVGVDEAEGAAQLTTQAQHVEVAKNAVSLTA